MDDHRSADREHESPPPMKDDPLRWYWDALAGKKPPLTTTPECGYFVAKINGKMVPARIYWEGPTDEDGNPCGDETLRCEIGGTQRDPEEAWLWCARRPVSFEEFIYWLGQMMEEVP